jgi:hypothetical protein
MSVLFPAPFAPIRACASPGLTFNEADLRATTAPYRFETSVASRRKSVMVFVVTL